MQRTMFFEMQKCYRFSLFLILSSQCGSFFALNFCLFCLIFHKIWSFFFLQITQLCLQAQDSVYISTIDATGWKNIKIWRIWGSIIGYKQRETKVTAVSCSASYPSNLKETISLQDGSLHACHSKKNTFWCISIS